MRRGLLCALLLLVPVFTFANVSITEVMYDLPTGADSRREWIEIFNTGNTAVDLTALKLFENNTNHKIVAVGPVDVAPNSYAVIVADPNKFKLDWPHYSGILFDSVFSLSNEGETIILRNASSSDVSSFAYTKTNGGTNGNSLNRLPAQAGDPSSSSILSRAPSPGTAVSDNEIVPPAPMQTVAQKQEPTVAESDGIETVAPDESQPQLPIAVEQPEKTIELTQKSSVPTYVWWLSAMGIALIGGGSIVFAQRFAKSEWDITEET